MPVVINRADPGGSGKKPDKKPDAKPDKGAAKAAQTKPAKSAGAAKGKVEPGDEKKKLILLGVVIVLSLAFLGYSMGLFDFGFGGGTSATTSAPAGGVSASLAPKTSADPSGAASGANPAPSGLRPGAGLPSKGVLPNAGGMPADQSPPQANDVAPDGIH